MTDILLHPNDSGEIPPIDDLGIEATRDLRHHARRDTTGEATENIGRYLVDSPSFEAIPRRVIDIDDMVVYLPETIGVVDLAGGHANLAGELEGPQSPPPPLPKPPRPSVPPRYAEGRAPFRPSRAFSRGRHAAPAPWWTRAAVAVGLAMVLGSALGLAIIWAVA